MDRRSHIGMASLIVVIALLAGVTSAIGVMARGDGSVQTVTNERGVSFEMVSSGVYAYNAERVVAEGVGWDIVTLFLVVPTLLVAAVFVARGSFRGRLFAAGLLGYLFYQYLEYSVTWAFGPLLLAYVGIFGGSLAALVWVARDLAQEGVAGRFDERFPRRGWTAFGIVMAALLLLLWVRRITLALGGDLVGGGLTSETTMTVQALDLGLVVPVLLISAFLVWQRSEAGRVLAAVCAVAFSAMALAILGMLVSAWAVEGVLEAMPVVIFGLAAAAAMGLGLRMFVSVVPADENAYPAAVRPWDGSGGRTRTYDQAVNSRPLYH